MTTLYRGPRGLVTEDSIATAHLGWSKLAIRDLTRIHIVRQRQAVGWTLRNRLFGVSVLLAALLLVPLDGWPAALLSAVVALVAGVDLAVTRLRDRSVEWSLTACHRGRRTVLFISADQREFDQVCRALRRAVEWQSERD